MSKKKDDLSIDSALSQLTSFFFELPDVLKETTNDDGNGSGKPVEPSDEKPAKRVVSTFNTTKKGKTDKSGEGGKVKPDTEPDGGKEPDEGDDE